MEDLLIGILASVVATAIVGGAVYKYKVKNKYKSKEIVQNQGRNQLAFQRSKKNSVNIEGGETENEKRNPPE